MGRLIFDHACVVGAKCAGWTCGCALPHYLGGAVIHRLWPEGGVVPVALSGGVLQGSALVRQAFKDEMRATQPEAAISFAQVRPVLGALEIAAQSGRR